MRHGRPVWSARATFTVVLGLWLASGPARAQDGGGWLSAFELLASSPELGGSDIPRDVPKRRGSDASVVPPEVMARVLTEEGPRPVPTASAAEAGPVVAPEASMEAYGEAPGEAPGDSSVESQGGRVSEPRVRLTEDAQRPPFKVLPVAVAVVPGLLLHGLGAWTAGDSVTARGLFAAEATGLGLI
ncbi:hypothetical protein D7V80_23935, partial [Corallococcus sp. CA054B]